MASKTRSGCSSGRAASPRPRRWPQPECAGPLQALGLRVDADHPARLDEVGAEQLVHQVGADVARPDDRGGTSSCLPGANRRLPGRARRTWRTVARAAAIAAVHDPGRIRCPASSSHPGRRPVGQPGDAGGGVPSTAPLAPVPGQLAVVVQLHPASRRSTAARAGGAAAEHHPAEEALSAMVSASLIRQSLIRLSISSRRRHEDRSPRARRPRSARAGQGRPSTKPISTSIRGCRKPAAGIGASPARTSSRAGARSRARRRSSAAWPGRTGRPCGPAPGRPPAVHRATCSSWIS